MASVWQALRRRPRLIGQAMATAWAFRGRGGVLPSRAVLQWRTATAYGSAAAPIETDDVIRFLEWRQALRRAM